MALVAEATVARAGGRQTGDNRFRTPPCHGADCRNAARRRSCFRRIAPIPLSFRRRSACVHQSPRDSSKLIRRRWRRRRPRCASQSRASPNRADVERAEKPLKILILGGTGFTGPEQVEYAIARGHEVTLINRNKTRPDFFKGRVEQLIGDMNGDMSALKGRKFDVVIDNPTTLPAWVRNVAQYMKGNTESLHLHLDDLGLSGQQQAVGGRDRRR